MLWILHKPERWKQPGVTDLKCFFASNSFSQNPHKVTPEWRKLHEEGSGFNARAWVPPTVQRHAHYVDNSKLPTECVNIVCDVSDPIFALWRLGPAPAPPCDPARISSIHAWLDEKQLFSPGKLLNKLYGPSTNQQIWPELDFTPALERTASAPTATALLKT